MELHYKYSHQYLDIDKWCHMYCMVGAEFMWLNQINQYGSDIETIYMRSGIEKCFILSRQKYIKMGEVCIYDQLIIIKPASITHWHSVRINHDRPSDMETYVIKKWNIAAVIMNKISSLLWCVGCGLQLLRYRHLYLHPFLWMIYSFVGKCDEIYSSYILKDIRNFLVCVVAAILVIINDILRINNITVPIFVTLWMICYHGNGRVVLPFVINQIQITFITNTIYSLAA